jgi:hypothetical protein
VPRTAWTPAQRWGFWAILALAAALRGWAALNTGPVHPDEIFQYLEQAHRLVFGHGVVTWEYRYGMRSWLLPLLLSVPMQIGAWIDPASELYLVLPRLSMVALSLLAVVAAYGLGARLSRFHAFAAMAAAAVWPDIVYFGGHVLTEPASTALVLAGAALLLPAETSRRRLVLAGLLLGLAAVLRFHYLPAMAVLALLSCGTQWRARWLPVIGGGLIAAAVGGAVDIAMGQAPFGWMIANVTQNVVADRAANYGVQPPFFYLQLLGGMWSFGFVAIVLLIVPVLRPYRALICAAAVNLLLHSLIGHKEYRFIFLSVALLVIVAAIGSAELIRRLQPRLSLKAGLLAAAALIPVWFGASAALASGSSLPNHWRAFLAGSEAARMLRAEPNICGVGVVGMLVWDAGGYTTYRHSVPFYVNGAPMGAETDPPLPVLAPAFNGIIAPERKEASLPAGYRRIGCSAPEAGIGNGGPTRVCAYRRSGGCDPAAAPDQELQTVMKRRDW